jgi:signal transduction histidine kinase
MGDSEMITTKPSAVAIAYKLDLQSALDFHAALLGMAGHDLRQPLTVIRQTYEWLEVRARTKFDEVLLELGGKAIQRLTEQLDQLATAIHFYEQTKSMEISCVAVGPQLWQACNENKDAALRKGLNIKVCPTKASVVSNTILLNVILRNLVSNAIKYTKPGGRILIGCRRSGDEVDRRLRYWHRYRAGAAAPNLRSIYSTRLDALRRIWIRAVHCSSGHRRAGTSHRCQLRRVEGVTLFDIRATRPIEKPPATPSGAQAGILLPISQAGILLPISNVSNKKQDHSKERKDAPL